MIRNYFKTEIRNLFRNKIYSFINIAGLSLGLACAMLIILYIKDEVSYDRFHTNGDNIYRVVTQEVKENGSKGIKDGNSRYFQGPRFTRMCPRSGLSSESKVAQKISRIRMMLNRWKYCM